VPKRAKRAQESIEKIDGGQNYDGAWKPKIYEQTISVGAMFDRQRLANLPSGATGFATQRLHTLRRLVVLVGGPALSGPRANLLLKFKIKLKYSSAPGCSELSGAPEYAKSLY